MRTVLACSLAASLFILSTATVSAQFKSGDWPQWRGPQRDAICTETGLLKEWPKGGPKLLWDSRIVNAGQSVGIGYSSLAITQGKIFTLGDRTPDKKTGGSDDGCFVICLDEGTGKEIWKAKIGPTSNYGGYPGPRCIPTIDGDRLYAIHPDGILVCLNAKNGAPIWQKIFAKDFGAGLPGWGYCESPTIDGDRLLCTPCGKDAVMVALNKITGELIWKTKLPGKLTIGGGCGYSSIVSTEAGGIKQYINVTGQKLGLLSVDAKTGKYLWHYAKAVKGTANIPTAVVHGDYVFTSTGYGAGAALLKLTSDGSGGIKAEEEYFLPGDELQNHHGGVVMLGDYIYGGHGHNQGGPFCLDWKSGKFAWGPGKAGRGSASVLYADGNLYFRYQNGDVSLVEASPKSFVERGAFKANIAKQNWSHPVIHHGRFYLRGDDVILCYDIKKN